MVEDLTWPWALLYAHCNILAYTKQHTHKCHGSSEGNHRRPKRGWWPHFWNSPLLLQNIWNNPPTHRVSLVAQLVKNSPAMRETWVRSLGWEDPLEKKKATHSSILAWRIPWTVESMGLQRVGHGWVAFTFHQVLVVACSLLWHLCSSLWHTESLAVWHMNSW